MTDDRRPYTRDSSIRGLTYEVGEEQQERFQVVDITLLGSTIRPAELPAAQPGIPMVAMTLEYATPGGPSDVMSFDLSLDQVSALAQTLVDALAQMMANAVEASLESFIADHPEWGPAGE